MKALRFIAFAVLSILLLTTFACCAGEELPPGITVEGIVDEALDAGANLDTCQFDVYMTIDMLMTMLGETFESKIIMYGNGTIDESNEKMYMYMYMNVEMAGQQALETSGKMYIVEDWIYAKMEILGEPATWMKAPIEAGDWEQHDIASLQIDWLLDAEAQFLRSETVDEIDCYVLQVTPDLEKLWALMQWAGMEELGLTPGLDLNDVITDFSVKQWIAKDTYFTRKTTQNLTMVLSSESLGISPELAGDFHASAEVVVTITTHHINEPVTIELPPEAEDAVVVPSFA